ncbi:MAG TPA: AAA domain-containing protein [Pirellulales bacterium]|nr:AAA domain-containing protein [Pirellulales bacterium]
MMGILYLEPLPPRAGKSEVLKWLAESGHIERSKIGRIDLQGKRAAVQVPEGRLERLARQLDGTAFGERRIRAWMEMPEAAGRTGEDHFQRLARLLDLEAKAAAERTLGLGRRMSDADAERLGNSLVELIIDDEDTSLGGRFLLTLVKRNRQLPIPWTRLGPGTPVLLSAMRSAGDEHLRGVVAERTPRALRVVVNQQPEDDEVEAWRLDLADDAVATERQRTGLARARSAGGDRLAELRQVLLGERAPRFKALPKLEFLTPLNADQQTAVALAMSAEDVMLVHGPPGTGKTTVVVEIIRQAISRGEKVLACAPSNLAVDNILERLVAAGERAVRLGHPARVLESLREHTLDHQVDEHPDVRLAHRLAKDAMALFRKASRYTRAKPEPGARGQMRQDARQLLADARRLEARAAEHVLDRAAVVCATTTGLDRDLLGQRRFDLVVIDEACQSTEPGSWIPLAWAGRLVLAGDHQQLPPTILSSEAAAEGFGVSLFERLADMIGDQSTRLLTVQYRMHEAIMGFSSAEFYGGQLVADETARGRLLADLPGMLEEAAVEAPLEFVDTAGAGYDEQMEPDGESRRNPLEARLVQKRIERLLALGVQPADIAVITPYAAQARLLREMITAEGLEIDTVDGFQGREKEVIVISLVRSNPAGEVGFLSDVRRMNVALTRARRKLIVVGDSATLASHPFYARWLEYIEARGAYRSVWEEPVE